MFVIVIKFFICIGNKDQENILHQQCTLLMSAEIDFRHGLVGGSSISQIPPITYQLLLGVAVAVPLGITADWQHARVGGRNTQYLRRATRG